MASFGPKQVGKGRERVKIKIIVPICFYSTCYREFQKNSKKIQKIEKHHYDFFSSQNRLGSAEKVWKWKLSFLSVLSRLGIENSKKNSKKIQKTKTHNYDFFRAKISWERLRESENKNYRFDQFLLDPE